MKKISINFFLIIMLILVQYIFSAENKEEKKSFTEIAKEITALESKLTNKTIAIFPLDPIGKLDANYGKYIAQKITHELLKKGKLTVVERSKLNKVLGEQQLSMSGAVDEEKAVKIGKLLSVEAVITGSVSYQNGKVEIYIRIVNTSSGRIIKSIHKKYKKYIESSLEPKGAGFTGSWLVEQTGPYFEKKGFRYRKLILDKEDKYELHFINPTDRYVVMKGIFFIDKNKINFRPRNLSFDGKPLYLPNNIIHKGTIYIVEGKLYFTITDIGRKKNRRLDAMDPHYRNVARRK